MLLVETLGLDGHVTGLDISPDFLTCAEYLIARAGKKESVSFKQGDVQALPFEKNTFDWVWSVDCVGYPTGSLRYVLGELLRVVKPGGKVAVLAWSSQRVLPGYPLLEDRLSVSSSTFIPIVSGVQPEKHFMRALTVFQQAGLLEVTAQSFLGEAQAPISGGIRAALFSLFDMLWDTSRPGVDPDDRKAFEHLCRPDSPACIVDQPGYYAFFTYTMFSGVVP